MDLSVRLEATRGLIPRRLSKPAWAWTWTLTLALALELPMVASSSSSPFVLSLCFYANDGVENREVVDHCLNTKFVTFDLRSMRCSSFFVGRS